MFIFCFYVVVIFNMDAKSRTILKYLKAKWGIAGVWKLEPLTNNKHRIKQIRYQGNVTSFNSRLPESNTFLLATITFVM